jgi:hypothetical protein
VKDVSGRVEQEGKIRSIRRELDSWMKTLPQPWTVAMEATIFSGWIYDHLLPHVTQIKVASIDAARDCCGQEEERLDRCRQARRLPEMRLLPECHMMPRAIRDRRRTLRYRHLLVRQMVQMKNRVSGLLMETGVEYNKQRLLPGNALRKRGGSSEHTAAVEAQPGDDRAPSEDRVRSG